MAYVHLNKMNQSTESCRKQYSTGSHDMKIILKRDYPNSKYLHGEATDASFEVSLMKCTRKFFHIRTNHHEGLFHPCHQGSKILVCDTGGLSQWKSELLSCISPSLNFSCTKNLPLNRENPHLCNSLNVCKS